MLKEIISNLLVCQEENSEALPKEFKGAVSAPVLRKF